VEDIKEN